MEPVQTWGLMLAQVNDSDGLELPVPATFILCKDRTTGYAYVDVDFSVGCVSKQLTRDVAAFCHQG